MPDPTLYLFDGYNLLHAGPYDDPRELVDALASFVATRGARGVVVFDGSGDDVELGPLSVRFAPNADTLLERLAAEHRERERVLLVSSDPAVSRPPAGRSRSSRRRRSSATSSRRRSRPRPPAASATSSTPRPGRVSSACAEENEAPLTAPPSGRGALPRARLRCPPGTTAIT